VVTTTWVGFDNYTPLGRREFGGTAALPIWIEFMAAALKGRKQTERQLPAGIVNVRINPETGKLAAAGQSNAIFEYFREENVPQRDLREEDGRGDGTATDELIRGIF
jgi:penicillin-binding protein 1A